MMHTPHAPHPMDGLRLATLSLVDAFDDAVAIGTRLLLHGQVNAIRALDGKLPIPYLAGPASAHEVVAEGPLARVLLYKARGPRRGAPILFVASLINKFYVLDLLPELSVISKLCDAGFDVYVLDWSASGELGPTLRFGDYVDGAIKSAAEGAKRDSGAAPIVLAYCMGGTLAAMFAARHPGLVRALCLLGTPIDFHESGLLALWTKREHFDAELLTDALGNMPPFLMQSGFKALNPADALLKLAKLALDAGDDRRARHMVAMESWLADNVSFPGGVYREYIRALYQDNALVEGTFRIAGEVVDLKKIVAPLLNVIALRDHICRPPSSLALMDRVGSQDKQVLQFDTGHIGIATSRASHQKLWPSIIDWMVGRA